MSNFSRQFIIYTMVGATGTAVHFAVLIAGTELLDADAVVASSVGAVIGATLNYLGNRAVTFRSRTRHTVAVVRFAAVAGLGFLINAATMELAVRRLGLHHLAAQVCATSAVLTVGFVLNRLWTFKERAHA